jgi:mRNA interferase MazF
LHEKANSRYCFGPTLIVVPLTTELKKLGQPTHCVLKKQRGLDETSMSEAEQIVTINKCQVIKYLGRTSKKHMESIDDSIRVSLHLDPDDTLPIPECVEFPCRLMFACVYISSYLIVQLLPKSLPIW